TSGRIERLDMPRAAGYKSASRMVSMVPSDTSDHPTKGDGSHMQMKHRFLLAAVIGTSLALPLSMPLAASAGRIYSRCVNSCNATRQPCPARSPDACATMFPNDPAARTACVSECRDICVGEEKDCKDRCQAIKNGECPTEP